MALEITLCSKVDKKILNVKKNTQAQKESLTFIFQTMLKRFTMQEDS